MKEVIERAIDTLTGADPLSLYRKDQAEIEQIEAQLEALNRSIQQQDNALSTMETSGTRNGFEWARIQAREAALHDRQGDLWRRLKELQGGRPRLAEQAFRESGPARNLAKQIYETCESLALLLSDEDRLRREFRDKTGVPIGDRPALCQISGISRDSLLMWLEKQEANHA